MGNNEYALMRRKNKKIICQYTAEDDTIAIVQAEIFSQRNAISSFRNVLEDDVDLMRKDGDKYNVLVYSWNGGYGIPELNYTRTKEKVEDNVNHPQHYNQTGMETIDVLKNSMKPSEFKGFLKGNIIKYVSRCDYKNNAIEDLEKAEWYINKLKEEYKTNKEEE